MKPLEPVEETQIIRRQTGFTWSYSFEAGAAGNRQKLILTGNTAGMERALVELRRAKVKLLELAAATAEELARPPPYEGFSEKDREEAGEDLLY